MNDQPGASSMATDVVAGRSGRRARGWSGGVLSAAAVTAVCVVLAVIAAAKIWWASHNTYEKSDVLASTVGRTPLAFDLSDSRDASRLGTPRSVLSGVGDYCWEGIYDVTIKLPYGRVLRADAALVTAGIENGKVRSISINGATLGPPEKHRALVESQIRDMKPTMCMDGRRAEESLADWLAGKRRDGLWIVRMAEPEVSADTRDMSGGNFVLQYELYWMQP